ncbi:MAG: ABC transporter ATP-binding protein [Lewinellaceae bacterium]|nr:ABC transporter ATP-binding protein [Saprospiraceae bacterium]MCB9342929.1 ABC transporter ATP-binding protein [Lewinellaceae bacterium]
MKVTLQNLGKRYRFDWIFKGIDFTFAPGRHYAVLGSNGSGKSTLLKVISGHLSPSKGSVSFEYGGIKVPQEKVYKQVSYIAPYIELIEEFTLEEAIAFHGKTKPFLPGIAPANILELLSLPKSKQKEIRFFSSGMKQRLKLALAICSNTPLLLLDEPSTNLDVQGIEWYKELVKTYCNDRLVIVASNDPQETTFCQEQLNMLDFKR